jgi:hypothetical protein
MQLEVMISILLLFFLPSNCYLKGGRTLLLSEMEVNVLEPKVLILDDDPKWCALHQVRLTRNDLTCIALQDGAKAIHAALSDPAIKFALVDEVLFVPGTEELQKYQGKDVVRKIGEQRKDISFVYVTDAPDQQSNGNVFARDREDMKLNRSDGVLTVFHKRSFENALDDYYEKITQMIRRHSFPAPVKGDRPVILAGLGLDKEIWNVSKEQFEREAMSGRWGNLIEVPNWQRFIGEVKPKERRIFVKFPTLERARECDEINSRKQSAQILFFLATRTALKDPAVINPRDYTCKTRRRKSTGAEEAVADLEESITECDFTDHERDRSYEMSNRDYMSEFEPDGHRKRVRSGIRIVRAPDKAESRLKTAICRLAEALAKENVGPKGHLFEVVEKGGYKACFEIRLAIYPISSRRSSNKGYC